MNAQELPTSDGASVRRSATSFWRLPAFTEAEISLINLMHVAQAEKTDDVRLRCTYQRSLPGSTVRLLLEIGGQSTPVYLRVDQTIERLGLLLFANEHADRQALLWRYRAGRLWSRLETFCGAPIVVRAANVEPLPAGWLQFSLSTGRIQVDCWPEPQTLLAALSGRQRRDHGPSLLRSLARLPMQTHLYLRPVRLPISELVDLDVGDTLIVDMNTGGALPGTFESAWHPLHYNVVYERSGTMTIVEAALAVQQAAMTGLGEFEVDIRIELGSCTLPLAELATLCPGKTMNLNKPLSDLGVALICQGRTVGRGTLIDVGGVLGVRIDHLLLQAPACNS